MVLPSFLTEDDLFECTLVAVGFPMFLVNVVIVTMRGMDLLDRMHTRESKRPRAH